MPAVTVVKVSAEQRRELEKIVSRPSEGAGLVRRARVILLSASGETGSEIALRLDLSSEAVSRIRRRFRQGGVDGLNEQPKAGRKDHAVPTETVERIVQLAMSPPPAGRSRWTTRLLAKQVGLGLRRHLRPSIGSPKVLRKTDMRRRDQATEPSGAPQVF